MSSALALVQRPGSTALKVVHAAPSLGPRGGTRRPIVGFTDKARRSLAELADDLTASGVAPGCMLTLTLPGDWRAALTPPRPARSEGRHGLLRLFPRAPRLPGRLVPAVALGRNFKQAADRFRKRLDALGKKLNGAPWGALWFLEFQKRGAPHLHVLIVGDPAQLCSSSVRSELSKSWTRSLWIQDEGERARSLAAGLRLEAMRKPDFRYASKYASKMVQKQAPEGFHGLGRFYGLWNLKRPEAVEVRLASWDPASSQDVERVLELGIRATGVLLESAPWADRYLSRALPALLVGLDSAHQGGSVKVWGPPVDLTAMIAAGAHLSSSSLSAFAATVEP